MPNRSEKEQSRGTDAKNDAAFLLCQSPTRRVGLHLESLPEPGIVEMHALREARGVAGFNHARNRVRAVIQGERAGGAVVSGVAQAAEGEAAAGTRGAGVDVDAAGAGLGEKAIDGGPVVGEDRCG